jgi:hypothetical protein
MNLNITRKHNYLASAALGAALLLPAFGAFAMTVSAVETRSSQALERDSGRAGYDDYSQQRDQTDFPTANIESAYEASKGAVEHAYTDVKKFVTQAPSQTAEERQHSGRE